MRLLVVSQYFWPESFRINDLVAELVARGHQVTVLTGKPNYPGGQVFPEYLQNPAAFAECHGAHVVRVPMTSRGQGALRLVINYLSFVLGAMLAGPWVLRGQTVDAIFVFEPSPVTVGLPAIQLGRLKNAPVVFWALDLWPETLAAIGIVRSPRLLGLIGSLVSYIYNRCTLVLGQSRGFLANIARYCASPAKIRYFPSWAEDVFAQTAATRAPEVSPDPNRFSIVFAGNLGEAQDLPAVLDAAEALRESANVRWLIVGDGRKSAWLENEVARRELQADVLILGRFPVERMPEFYAHADALLVSLKKDPVFSMTIPGKVQSYLMAGIPIIGMLDGEGARVIEEAQAGLTCPAGDGAALAKAVQELAAMPVEQRGQLGSNGRQYAATEFDRCMLIGRLESWLTEAIDMHRQRRER